MKLDFKMGMLVLATRICLGTIIEVDMRRGGASIDAAFIHQKAFMGEAIEGHGKGVPWATDLWFLC